VIIICEYFGDDEVIVLYLFAWFTIRTVYVVTMLVQSVSTITTKVIAKLIGA